jgi:extracellular elastinolytic metalloproteinase
MGVGATTTGGPIATPPGSPTPCAPCGTLDETDTDPSPSYESPLHDNGTITFAAENKDGDPVTTARFYVGHFEARVSPIADTNPATTGANLDNVAKMAPGTYELTVNAQGYGFFRFRKTVRRGETSTFRVRLAQNVASANAGAVATGDTNGANAAAQAATLRALIDDTENTQWETPANATGPISVDGKKVTIDLAGTKAVQVRSVQVSAMLRSGQSRFSALRQFEVWACNSDKANCSTDAGFTKVYTSGADASPGNSPRPVSPNLILRSFDIPNTKATHLRFVVKTNQCTGGPNFLGEQDADPANPTDCPSAGPATARFVRAAEFQAFEDDSSLRGKHGRHGRH